MKSHHRAEARRANRSFSRFILKRCGAIAGAALGLAAPFGSAAAEVPAPAAFGTQVEMKNDYVNRGDGSFSNATVLGADYALLPQLALRVDLPVVYAGAVEGERSFGLGDVLIRPTVRAFSSRNVALLLSAELGLDSASSKALGTGKNSIAPSAVVHYVASQTARVGLSLQHQVSFGGDRRREDIRTTRIRPFTHIGLPLGFWLQPDQRFQIEHRGARRFTSTSVVEVGKAFGERVRVYVDPGIQINDPGPVGWLVTAGVQWSPKVTQKRAVAAAPSSDVASARE
jgi:hypothetical protein